MEDKEKILVDWICNELDDNVVIFDYDVLLFDMLLDYQLSCSIANLELTLDGAKITLKQKTQNDLFNNIEVTYEGIDLEYTIENTENEKVIRDKLVEIRTNTIKKMNEENLNKFIKKIIK